MHDSSIQLSRLITAVLWFMAASMFLAAWTVALFANWHVAVMLGFTGCLFACLAGVSQVRCYTLRICGLVRVVGGLEIPEPADLRSMRS
jgi:hypothetical protein